MTTPKDDAILQAYARLGEEDRINIDSMVDILRAKIKYKNDRIQISREGCIEAIGKIGIWLTERDTHEQHSNHHGIS